MSYLRFKNNTAPILIRIRLIKKNRLKGGFFSEVGAPGGSRTHDLWLRRPTLYPSELQARALHIRQFLIELPVHVRLKLIKRRHFAESFSRLSR